MRTGFFAVLRRETAALMSPAGGRTIDYCLIWTHMFYFRDVPYRYKAGREGGREGGEVPI